jgi:hypothetical protein
VERGHNDTVAPDEWVAYEYAKVCWFYDTRMRLEERTPIEFFNAPHEINGNGTFEFLREHLQLAVGCERGESLQLKYQTQISQVMSGT